MKRALAGLWLGAVTLTAQVLLLRELWCTVWGSEALAALAVAVWLAAGGAGSAIGARLARGRAASGGRLPAALALFAASVPAAVILLRLRPDPGTVPGLGTSLLYALASLGSAGLLAGALFPLALHALYPAPETRNQEPGTRNQELGSAAAAALYRWDMAGSVLGALAVTASVLLLGLGTLRAALLDCAAAMALAAWLARPGSLGGARRALPALALTVLAASVAAMAVPDLDRATLSRLRAPEELLFSAETAAGRLEITGSEGQVNAWLSGRFAASPGAVERAEAVAAAAAGECERPAAALLLGDPLASGAAQFAAHGCRVTAAVPDRAAAARFAPAAGVELLAGDGRAVLREALPPFDLVLIDAGAPATFAQARLLTAECFAAARSRLSNDGVLAVVLPANPAHLTAPQRRAAGSVWLALGEVFPRRRLWALPAVGLIMVGFASDREPAPRSEVAARVGRRGVRLVSFYPGRLADPELAREAEERIAPAIEAAARGPNRDGLMAAVLDQMQADRVRLSGGAGESLRPPRGGAWLVPLTGLAAGIVLLAVGRLRRGASAAPVSAFAAGLAGAGIETVALVGYQVSRGGLYAEVGLVLAAFMAGGAAGAELVRRRAAREAGLPPAATSRALLAVAVAAAGCAALAWWCPQGWAGGMCWIAVMLAAGGGVGATYAAAAASRSASPGLVYALDLAGAAAGSLAAVAAVPWAGLAPAALGAAGLAALAAARRGTG